MSAIVHRDPKIIGLIADRIFAAAIDLEEAHRKKADKADGVKIAVQHAAVIHDLVKSIPCKDCIKRKTIFAQRPTAPSARPALPPGKASR